MNRPVDMPDRECCQDCRELIAAGWSRRQHPRLTITHKYKKQALEPTVAGADYCCTTCGLEWRRHKAGWRSVGRDRSQVSVAQ